MKIAGRLTYTPGFIIQAPEPAETPETTLRYAVGTGDKYTNTGKAYLYSGTAPDFSELGLAASDGATNAWFGFSVAISGNRVIVGAYKDDAQGTDSGSVYVFDAETGQQLHKLVPADGAASAWFGHSVAISGNRVIMGAPYDYNDGMPGSAYIYDVATGQQLHKITASDGAANDAFGWSVAISGNRAIVGAYGDDDHGSISGSAYIYDVETGAQLHKITASDGYINDRFGYSVAISGNRAIVGAFYGDDKGSDSGSAYIYDVDTGAQLHKLVPADGATRDYFGYSVAISGNRAIVGAWGDDRGNTTNTGAAYIFDVETGAQLHRLIASDAAEHDSGGHSVSISGNRAIVGALLDDDRGSNSGSAYIYDVETGAQLHKFVASDGATNNRFGGAVAIG